MKTSLLNLKFLSTGSCLLAALLANQALAQSQYFTTVANGGTYSWDDANWNASGSTANTGPYTSTWTAGDFARFYNGAGDNFTVTVNASESMAGLYLDAGSTATLNLNDAGNNTGSLSIVPNTTLQDGFGYTQAFLTGGGIVTINAPIVGTGGIEEESGGGHLQLYGNNTYSGGTLFTSSSTFVDFNSSSSFGTGPIGYYNTTFSLMENNAASPVTLANNIQILGGTTGIDFIGAGTTTTGTWNLGTFNTNIRNNGVSTHLTIAGAMSGTGGVVTFSGANGGTINLNAVNSYTGNTVIGSSGDTAVTVALGVANAIASSANVTMAGGTLNLGGFNHTMTGTTLGLTANSTIDFTGSSSVSFANSSALSWTGTLDLANWVAGTTTLQIGTDATGLTAAQLADIEFNGIDLGDAGINASGDIYIVPEPSSLALGLLGGLGGLGLIWNLRRRQG